MPSKDDVLERIARVVREVPAICQREGLRFVLVVEPADCLTGVFVATDSSIGDDAEQVVRETRRLFAAAVESLAHSQYAVVYAGTQTPP